MDLYVVKQKAFHTYIIHRKYEQQIKVCKIFKQNLNQRVVIKSEIEPPCDPDEIQYCILLSLIKHILVAKNAFLFLQQKSIEESNCLFCYLS